MNTSPLRLYRAAAEQTGPLREPSFLMSSYNSGATKGQRLGTPGYSYDFVAKLFAPLFERLGKYTEVEGSHDNLDGIVQKELQEDRDPVHIVFRPFHDAYLAPHARNVVVPAWEFPDIPNEAFDGNVQNNWVETANRCSMVLVGGPFTAKALESAGVKTPIRIVPVPIAEKNFALPRWKSDHRVCLDCSPYVFADRDTGSQTTIQPIRQRSGLREKIRTSTLKFYRNYVKPLVPRGILPVVLASLRAGAQAWGEEFTHCERSQGLNLDGVVYTSIFNPADGRKNWEDMITAFLYALRDCEDATLVLKLITSNPGALNRVLGFYRRLGFSHQCRLVLIPDFLSDADMMRLTQASAYYLTTTRAEGNCLPLMDYLAAGRPGISPSHTAIGDYFDTDIGFVVESHPEPCSWPQDTSHRWRSSWHRLVWPSLVEQIRRSYDIAKNDSAAYETLASAARDKMLHWAHPEAVWPQLRSAMRSLIAPTFQDTASEEDIAETFVHAEKRLAA